ncbi:MAG: ATP-binding cassette domain-containing protein [Mariprofundaceae bacterium]
MIQASYLSRKYGDQRTEKFAVHDLSFHVQKGEVMGLLGPNGAGKSTTMKMLTCFLPPSSGTATIDGDSLEETLLVRRKIGYLPENAPSYSDLDVCSHLSFIGRMHAIPKGLLGDKIGEMSRACGLEQVLHRRINELSKGYRQRVGLAASMLHGPECLILDEPTTGLDPNQIVEIRHLIRRLGEEKTVLLSSHVLPEVEAVCDRMMIIDGGQLQVIGTSEELAKQISAGVVLHVVIKGDGAKTISQLQQNIPDVDVDLNQQETECHIIIRHVDSELALAEKIFQAAVQSHAVILEMRPEKTTLEDVFRELTGAQT